MTKHKFTDEEIIKALECCGVNCDCAGCAFVGIDCGKLCINKVMQLVLDLINRQRAEIERLKKLQS